MVVYSPIAATYGARVDQLLETPRDYSRYHDKLNRKLQRLRHRCQVVTKDTKKYSTKEKYSKFTSDGYDHKSKLYGVLVLLHAERDLALAETLKLRARQRGKLKKSEKKVLSTRLKKVVKTTERLVELTNNETQWITRVQYIAYAKLARAEYLIHGKFSKQKNSSKISHELALSFAALSYLRDIRILPDSTLELIHSKYEYTLKLHAGNILSSADLHNFVVQEVHSADKNGDEMVKLLLENGYKAELQDIDMGHITSIKQIEWRAFTAEVHDSQVEQLIQEARNVVIKDVSDHDNRLLKWQQALEKQETRIVYHEDQSQEIEAGAVGSEENDQILLAYIKYNVLFTSILRDNYLFNQLLKQWNQLGTSMPSRLTKFKEIERIVQNLVKYLQDVMELPGVYSDDDLMAQLQLCKLYFQLSASSGCLGSLYRSKGKYMESLALHVDAYQKLESKLNEIGALEDILVPGDVLSKRKVEVLQSLIKSGWSSVFVLAEYEKSLGKTHINNFEPALIERLNSGNINPADITLNNLFPLRPKLRPVQSKPTLFDLAFNYINYDDNEDIQSEDLTDETPAASEPPQVVEEEEQQQSSKKRGFLSLFGR